MRIATLRYFWGSETNPLYTFALPVYREQQSILGTNNKKNTAKCLQIQVGFLFFSPFLRAGRGWDDRCRAKWCIARDQPRRTWFLRVEQNRASTHPPVDPRHVEADHDERFVVQHYDVNGAMNGEEMLAKDEESCLGTIWKHSVMDRIST